MEIAGVICGCGCGRGAGRFAGGVGVGVGVGVGCTQLIARSGSLGGAEAGAIATTISGIAGSSSFTGERSARRMFG